MDFPTPYTTKGQYTLREFRAYCELEWERASCNGNGYFIDSVIGNVLDIMGFLPTTEQEYEILKYEAKEAKEAYKNRCNKAKNNGGQFLCIEIEALTQTEHKLVEKKGYSRKENAKIRALIRRHHINADLRTYVQVEIQF